MEKAAFTPVPDAETLEQLVAASHEAPVVLFQHDPFCGTSAAAHREMTRLGGPVHLVDVARQRELSAGLRGADG
jgi:monothiol bacilliredoxin BrxC